MSRKTDRNTLKLESEGCRVKDSDKIVRGLEAIVHHYITHHRQRAARELAFYALLPTFEEAIEWAASAQLPSGKRHPHQYRIPKRALKEVKHHLLFAQDELQDSSTFADLYERVTQTIGPIKGVGRLMRYDTALRLGANLHLEPEVVYLHAGTRDGAEKLGLEIDKGFLELSSLPEPLRALTPREIEDCLCIYKDNLKPLM